MHVSVTTERRWLENDEILALLNEYGIPAPRQRFAATADEAAAIQAEYGVPVALKVVADGVVHKSDISGVKLNLAGCEAVKQAFAELQDALATHAPEAVFRGALVQEMAAPGQEVIVGIKRDPVFGPAVVVGLGGVWVELVRDSALRLTPITEEKARQMIAELRAAPLLTGYRGRPPADVDALVDILVKVGRLAVERPEIEEMDLNPVVVAPKGGGAVAVDARILVSPRPAAAAEVRDLSSPVRQLMNPRSIAVVGASANRKKSGGRLLHYLRKHGYEGRIYPVNPKETEIGGLTCYPSIGALPEAVDLACIMIPDKAVPDAIAECGAKGIRTAIVYTSGFSETGAEGKARQEEMMANARRYGVHICGPNTVGTVNSIARTTTAFGMAFEAETVPTGDISFVTQSGALGGSLLSRMWAQGIGFARWICTGNEADLTLADYLLYLADDPATKVIALFLESIRDPATFRLACERARANGKAIVAYKTGISEVGHRAVASHTGSLAGDDAVYEAFFRECGVVRVPDLQALADAAVVLSWQPLPAGRRVAVVSTSGGACSVIADECEKYGIEIPLLREETRAKIDQIIPPFGASQNPVDITMQVTVNPEMFGSVLDSLLEEPQIDVLLMMLTTNADPPAVEVAKGIVRAARKVSKPVVVARTGAEFLAPQSLAYYQEHRIPVFPMPDRAVKALKAAIDASRFLAHAGQPPAS